MRLGILDYVPIDDGDVAAAALAASTRLAQHAETLGYTRYWVSEHHGNGALASVSPEVVMAHLAAQRPLFASDPEESAARRRNAGRLIAGTAPRVAAQLSELAEAYGDAEIMINPMVPEERNRSLALLALELRLGEATS